MVYRFPEICDKGYTIKENVLNNIVISALNKKLAVFDFEGKIENIIAEYKKNNEDYKMQLKLQNQKLKLENDIRILYNKKLEQSINIDEFKKQYATLKSKEKEIECEIEKLEKENKDKISVERLVSILKEFKTAENFDNNIMKQLINRIEIGEDKTVSIIFNF